MAFVHLHAHSHYSFLQGIPAPKVLVGAAKDLGQTAVAVTDSSNVCGVVEASEAAEKAGVRLIVGVELWTMDGEGKHDGPIPGTGVPAPGYQLVLLVRDAEGWRNLSALVTIAHRQRSFCPRITVEQLSAHRAGLHVLTGGRWGIFREPDRAEERLLALVAAVGKDAVDAEVVDHGHDEDGPRNLLAAELARKVGVPVVATNDSRYLRAEDAGVLEAMVEIGTGGDHELALVSTATDQAWFKTEAEMAELWPQEWLDRSGQVAELCTFSLPRGKPMLPRVEKDEALASVMGRFPAPDLFPEVLPEEVDRVEGPAERAPVNLWFRWLCRNGLQIRLREEPHALQFATEEEYFAQLEFECGVIEQMEYVVYHLIVAEFTNWAKDNQIYVGPGRGSAAGSVAVWALRITDVNPRQFGLFFERFLNPERRGLPDIDMDFEQEGRERVIAHVRERYGEACVGQILTIGKMKAKAALTDAARVCTVRYDETKFWSAHVDGGPKSKLKDSLGQGYLKTLRQGNPLFHRVAELALHLEGKPRQQGVHAAGVIIASDPISRFCPMHYVPDGDLTCTGLDMDAAEKVGLVKFDFLGLKTLDVVRICQRTVADRTGSVPVVVDPLFDDPEVFELLQRGDTEGIFQLESGGMTSLIRRLVPENFEEVICMLALYRPGPLKAGMVSSWIERKHGREEVESIHPLLDEVLRPTYGLMVYQEQALSTARILAGFSLGEADLLRRAIGKKKADEMAAQRQNFVKGCWETNQIDEREATRVFNLIDYFSGYSFNKCIDIETPVVTRRGIIRADEVVVGDEVLEISDERFRRGRVRKVWPIEEKERLRIVFDDGTEVICTAEHRFVDFDTGEEVEAGRAAAEGRRLAGLVRSDLEAERRPGGAQEDVRGVPRHPEADPLGHHVEGMDRTRRRDEEGSVGDREGDLSEAGRTGREGGTAQGLEEEGAGAVQVGVHGEDARVERGGEEPVDRVLLRGHRLCPAPLVPSERASEDGLDRPAGGLRGGPPRGSGRTPSLQADLRGREVPVDEVSGRDLERLGAEDEEDARADLHRLLHELGSAQTAVEGDLGGGAPLPSPWRVAPRRPVRIDRLPPGPVVDLEVGGDHLYVLGNGLISHNSHSAAYAIVTYMTAKLKVHHPVEFMAATMTLDMKNADKVRQYSGALRRTGIEMLRPDVNRSAVGYTPEDGRVRFGLGAVRGLERKTIEQILAGRPFSSVEDLVGRVKMPKKTAESLIWAGAVDSVEADRFEAWWKTVRPQPKPLPKKVAADQILLFGGGKTVGDVRSEEERLAEEAAKPARPTAAQLSGREATALGVSLGTHPLARYSDVSGRIRTHTLLGLRQIGPEKVPFTVVGRIESCEFDEDRRGEQVCFLTLEDTEASVRVVLRGDTLRSADRETVLVDGACVVLHGNASAFETDDPTIMVERVESLSAFRWRANRTVEMELGPSDRPVLGQIRVAIDRHIEGGTHELLLKIWTGTDDVAWARLDRKIRPTEELVDDLERITGRPEMIRIPTSNRKIDDVTESVNG